MLLDVFAPSKSIDRASAHTVTQQARSTTAAKEPGAVHVLCQTPGDLVHHNDVHDLRALQLQNCRPATPAEFDRAMAAARGSHRAQMHPYKTRSKKGKSQAGAPKFAKDYASAAERAAFEKFKQSTAQGQPLSGRLDKPMHTSADITAQPNATAANVRPRRAVDAQMFENARASRTDTTTAFHSTILRAMAHSQT